MNEDEAIRSLSGLAQPVRLRTFRSLVVAGRQGLTPGAIAEELGIGATVLSFHLKELAASGLVTQQRDGRHLIYRAAFDRMNGLLDYLTAHCCQGETCGEPSAMSCASC